MSTASWHSILTAVAKSEGKTLREWSDEIDQQAARMYAAIPEYLRKPKLLPAQREAS